VDTQNSLDRPRKPAARSVPWWLLAVIIYVAVTLANLTSAWISEQYIKHQVQHGAQDMQQRFESLMPHL
jgi:hypothetical protein